MAETSSEDQFTVTGSLSFIHIRWRMYVCARHFQGGCCPLASGASSVFCLFITLLSSEILWMKKWTYSHQMQSSAFLFCIKNTWTVFNLDSNYLVHTSAAHSSAFNKSRMWHCFGMEHIWKVAKRIENASKTLMPKHVWNTEIGDLAIRFVQNLYSDRFLPVNQQ